MSAPTADVSVRDILRPEIRKLRKKLRQIENLERLNRSLTEDEEDKVFKKFELRSTLQELLSQCPEASTSTEAPYSESSRSQISVSHGMAHLDDVEEQYSGDNSREENLAYELTTEDKLTQEPGGDGEQHDVEAQELSQKPEAAGSRKRHLESSSVSPESLPVGSQLEQLTNCLKPEQPVVEPPKKQKGNEKQKSKGQEKKQAPSISKEEQENQKFRDFWKHCPFRVRYLEGHNDSVLSVAADGHLLASGGRDTTIKVWDMDIGAELKSFGGHTDTVTCVLLLSEKETKDYVDDYELEDGDRIIVSGSSDCSIKLWSIKSGQLILSMYTYNPVTSIAYSHGDCLIISGSGGGKLELWDLKIGKNVLSIRAHEDAINCIKVTGSGDICSASQDGVIKIYQYRDSAFHLKYESESVKTDPGMKLSTTPIHCLLMENDMVYYGDDGVNIKILDWNNGFVKKIRNHTSSFGITDSMAIIDHLLLSSCYDLDSGQGSINIYHLADAAYLGTLNDGDTSRIFCLACTKSRNGRTHRWITGGDELKVFDEVLASTTSGPQDDVVDTVYDYRFSLRAENTDIDTESEGSDLELTGHLRGTQLGQSEDGDCDQPGWFSWCSVL